jgi:arginine:ornithine antiporter/lysine permease
MWLTNGMVQLFLILTFFSEASYLALISLSTAMILLPYLFSAIYGLSLAWRGKGKHSKGSDKFGRGDTPVAAIAVIYCLWLLYAAGLKYLLLSALLYAPGAVLYIVAKKQRAEQPFTGREWVILAFLVLLAAVASYMLSVGRLSI